MQVLQNLKQTCIILLPANPDSFKTRLCFEKEMYLERWYMYLIGIRVCSAVQTVTDGLALSSEETSRTKCEALTTVSAQLCSSFLCESLHEHLHTGSVFWCCVFLCLCVIMCIWKLNQKAETAYMCIRSSCLLHSFLFISLFP